MTSREAFEALVNKFDRGLRLDLTPHHDTQFGTYLRDQTECAYRIYQASQAQQASVIAELVEALEQYKDDVTYDDDILGLRVIKSGEVARKALAKAKGK